MPAESYYSKVAKRSYAGDVSPRAGSPASGGSMLSQASDTDSARHVNERSRNGTPKPKKGKN